MSTLITLLILAVAVGLLILRTLQDADVPGWVTSIHRRGIHFPAGVADEVTHRLSVVMNQ